MEIRHSLNPKPAGAFPTPTNRAHGTPTRMVTLRLLLAPNFELIDTPGDDGVTRQRAPAGDSLNDEQWSDDLPNPPSAYQQTCPNRSRERTRT